MKIDKDVRILSIDLAKVLSYLSELQQTDNQIYLTENGMGFLEGAVLSSNKKIKVVSKDDYDKLQEDYQRLQKLYLKLKNKRWWQ